MALFGQSAEEFDRTMEEQDDAPWIKGMRQGENRIRILDPTSKWIAYREHYAPGINYFPCAKEPPVNDAGCVGCNHADEEVKKRTRKFSFCGLDDQDRLTIFKVGTRVRNQFVSKEQRLASADPPSKLQDRDYLVIRSGQGKDTTYDIEGLDKAPLEDDGERINIQEVLGDRYEAATRFFSGAVTDEDGDAKEDSRQPEAVSGGTRRRAAQSAGAPAASAKSGSSSAATRTRRSRKPADDQGEGQDVIPPSAPAEDKAASNGEAAPDFADMDKNELKDWLEKHNVEFPANATRSVLVAACEQAAGS